jgi:2-polyprenyl-6-methoxyphenol hydroxylase-like FAD-dependent oxidoreductase
MMTTSLYDVSLVGAGPVGLATAIALYRRGIKNILVVDRVVTLYQDSVKSDSQYLEQPRIILIRQQENTLGYLLHAPLSLDSLHNC